jgi:hypothetical protein
VTARRSNYGDSALNCSAITATITVTVHLISVTKHWIEFGKEGVSAEDAAIGDAARIARDDSASETVGN